MNSTAAPLPAFDLWCEHAWLGGPSSTDGVVLHVEGERIVSVVSGVRTPPAGSAVLEGLTLPGMANVHVRSTHRMLRSSSGTALERSLGWMDRMGTADPAVLGDLARSVYAELSLAGYTTICELISGASTEHIAALTGAAAAVGVRLAVADAWTAEVEPRAWVARVDPFAESVMRRSDVRFVAAAAELDANAVEAMGDLTTWAAQMGVPLHAVVARPGGASEVIEALARTGAMGHRGGCVVVPSSFEHSASLAELGHQRGFVAVDPFGTTAHHLPVAAVRATGGRIVLANDVHAPADPFGAMRSLARIARQHARPSEMGTTELLRTLTVDAMAALGWRDSGVLASGHLADLVTVSVRAPRFAGLANDDLLSSVLALATPADISHVAVGGRLIVDRGRHLVGDVRNQLDRALSATACGGMALARA